MAQKEYLKMADVFEGKTCALYETEIHDKCGCVCDAEDKQQAKYISHAINSHDELVVEVERLREELSASMSALHEVERLTSELIKNGCYVVDDINAEVSYSIKLAEAIEE